MKKLKLMLLAVVMILSVIAVFACGNTEQPQSGETEKTASETKKSVIKDGDATEATETEATETAKKAEKTDYSKYFAYKEFELPTDFRQAAVDYMLEQANVVWTPGADFSTSEDFEGEGWGISLDYKKGTEYHGIPYANSYTTVSEFESYLDSDRAFTTDPSKWLGKNWQSIPGLECSSSIVTAIGHFADITGYSDAFFPGKKECMAVPLGDYTYEQNLKSTYEITETNKPAVMFPAYTLLQKGDVIMRRTQKGASHVRMVRDNHVETKSDGSIVAKRSYVTCLEQTNSFDKTRTDGVNTTWFIDHTYDYEKLFSDGYIPTTIREYTEGNDIPMYIGLTKEIKTEDLSDGAFVGAVETNSYFRFVSFTIFNKDGSVAKRFIRHNTRDYESESMGLSNKKIDFRKYSYNLFDGLTSGEYTFVVVAGIPAGEAELVRTDFTYSK